ncbi:C-type lectin-like type-II membrane protein [Vaccinia virus]|nr:C-type lectin-like type-II membrane protein [Vaccinia virus]
MPRRMELKNGNIFVVQRILPNYIFIIPLLRLDVLEKNKYRRTVLVFIKITINNYQIFSLIFYVVDHSWW